MEKATPKEAAEGIEVNRDRALASSGRKRLNLKRLTESARRPGRIAARVNRLTYLVREAIYGQEPLFLRGVDKQTGDLVKHGFLVTKPNSDEEHDQDDLVQAWLRNEFVTNRVREALIAAHLHGDGLLEIEWDDDGRGEDPVKAGSLPIAVHLIDPVSCEFEKDVDAKGNTVEFLVQYNAGGSPVTLHPDRYHQFVFHRKPGYLRGLSTMEVAYHSALSKVKGDQGLGEMLFHSGQPKVHAQVKDAEDGDLEDTTEMLNDPDFVRGFATDDRTTLVQLNPIALDPSQAYGVLEVSIAAAIGIPVMMLKGAQAGAVTGSETNLTDYHSDLRMAEVTVLEPFYTRVVGPLIGSTTKDFDIKWMDPPVSRGAMATAAREAATAYTLLYTNGFTKEAAARIAGLDVTDEDFQDEEVGTLPPIDESTAVPPGQAPPGTPPPQAAPAAAPTNGVPKKLPPAPGR